VRLENKAHTVGVSPVARYRDAGRSYGSGVVVRGVRVFWYRIASFNPFNAGSAS
jgi:hypothetical protein